MLDLLTGLSDKSLVVADTSGAEVRYRLLEMVRAYGRERLDTSGERAGIQLLHLDYVLRLVQQMDAQPSHTEQMNQIVRLEEEHDNLRVAMDWSLAGTEDANQAWSAAAEAGLRLCAGLQQFWRIRGHHSEGRKWCARALASAAAQARSPARAKVLDVAGTLANLQGDYARARTHYEESLVLSRLH